MVSAPYAGHHRHSDPELREQPDRWFPGDVTVAASRDGRALAGQVEGMDVCTGEIPIRGAGQLTVRAAC